MKFFLASTLLASSALAKTYLKETFDTDAWEKKWVQSEAKADYGKFVVTAGKFFADKVGSRGLQTSQDARFYALSVPFDSTFDNSDKTLVVQFSAKFEQNIDCGGGYVKLLPPSTDLKKMDGDAVYNIMFGPDICGGDKKTHVIFNYKGKNHLIKKTINPESDQLTHLYTLIVRPDQTYEVLIDNESKEKGSLFEDWDMLPPKEIADPDAKKPEDWEDVAEIDDPEDKKPEGQDDVPATIVDPAAKKPEDWDDDMDGQWEAPKVPNPDFKGEWKPKKIPNPKYKGPWVHPKIANPEFKEDASIYKYKTAGLALDLWQVKSGTIFDDFIVTDSIEEAKAFAEETFLKKREAEKAAKKVLDDEEAKKMEAEMEAQKAKDKATKEAEGDKPKDEPASEEKKAEEEHEEL